MIKCLKELASNAAKTIFRMKTTRTDLSRLHFHCLLCFVSFILSCRQDSTFHSLPITIFISVSRLAATLDPSSCFCPTSSCPQAKPPIPIFFVTPLCSYAYWAAWRAHMLRRDTGLESPAEWLVQRLMQDRVLWRKFNLSRTLKPH